MPYMHVCAPTMLITKACCFSIAFTTMALWTEEEASIPQSIVIFVVRKMHCSRQKGAFLPTNSPNSLKKSLFDFFRSCSQCRHGGRVNHKNAKQIDEDDERERERESISQYNNNKMMTMITLLLLH